jgi:hypothetical protein
MVWSRQPGTEAKMCVSSPVFNTTVLSIDISIVRAFSYISALSKTVIVAPEVEKELQGGRVSLEERQM